MSKKIQQFIRKLNSTELNIANTNDSYVRISKEIQDRIPSEFFSELNSKIVTVINCSSKNNVQGWVRYQHYPTNNEYRIVSLSEIYNDNQANSGDYVIIEKVIFNGVFHYEIYMRTYDKISFKYNKGKDSFEILNLEQVKKSGVLESPIILNYKGNDFESKIAFEKSAKKREDSPVSTEYFSIINIPEDFFKAINRDNFGEIIRKGSKFYLSVENSWDFNQYTI